VQRDAARAHELGKDELGGCVGAVGNLGCGFPVGEGQKFAGLYLRSRSLGAGEPVGDLDQHRGETRSADTGSVSAASVEVVDLTQQPADCADRGAEKTRWGEVSTYWR
jgi:hypothetical protein